MKENTENQEEKKHLKQLNKIGRVSAYDPPEIGKRFRPSIQTAHKQLKKSCTTNEAGLVIIQDVRHFFILSCIP